MHALAVVIFFAAAAANNAAHNTFGHLGSYIQHDKLRAADAVVGDGFGYSVAIDGDTVVCGATGDDDDGSGSGSAYVLRTSDGGATYGQVAKLTAADASGGEYFGCSVAIDGDTIVVGAYGEFYSTGAAYVFRTTDGGITYDQVAKLTASDVPTGDRFGVSVAIDGDTVVIGTSYGEAAYVFRTNNGGATYDQVVKLTASDPATLDSFGRSVAIDGNTVVVGDYYKSSGIGAVYVFRTLDGGATYVEVAKLTATNAQIYDYFGFSVAIDGDTVVVGVYGDDDAGAASGSAYVFRTTDGGATYAQVAKLTASGGVAGDYFGYSVAIDGGTIVIGAYGKDDAGADSGAAYVVRTSDGGATYAQEAKLTAADAFPGDQFGRSVAIYGDTIVIGAVGDDGIGSSYVFAPEQPTVAPTAAPTASGDGDGKSGGESDKSGGDKGAVAVIAGAGVAAVVALLLLLVGVSCFFYGRSKGSAAEPSGVNSRPESYAQPPKELVPAEEAAVVSVAPEAEETSVEQPPPPPAKSGFRRGEPEPTAPQSEAEKEAAPPPNYISPSPFSALRAAREREPRAARSGRLSNPWSPPTLSPRPN